MSSPMGTNPGALEPYLTRFDSLGESIRGSLDRFDTVARATKESWDGAAWAQYELAHARWTRQITHIHEKVRQLRVLASSMSQNLVSADQRGMSAISGP